MKRTFCRLLCLTVSLTVQIPLYAQGRVVARLFWQDDSNATARYGDLRKSTDGWSIDPQPIDGFPELELAEQSLVQMQADSGIVLIGIRDHADGTIGSGWVAIESGAVEEPHGNHSHWHFDDRPRVVKSRIDADQGNPAHVYRYGQTLVMANDRANGFTITNAAQLRSAATSQAATTFHDGGNSHITLAVIGDQVAYATWIARDGDDRGRVDVVGLGENAGKRYSFQCPSGGLHGATTNSGKVFFAPSDGICWVAADVELVGGPESVQVHHLSLGEDAEGNPRRTGAFTNLDDHVLFTTGRSGDARLCWVDASSQSPCVDLLSMELGDGDSLSTPVAMKTRMGKCIALMFRENKESPETDSLLVVDCDPDRNGEWDDASCVKTIPVGRNRIEGHSGHHDVAVLPSGRDVVVSNPADATLSVISLADFSVTTILPVEGVPTRLIAVGG